MPIVKAGSRINLSIDLSTKVDENNGMAADLLVTRLQGSRVGKTPTQVWGIAMPEPDPDAIFGCPASGRVLIRISGFYIF